MIASTNSDRSSLLAEIAKALEAQDIPRAAALARQALDNGLENPLLLNLRAFWHESEGRNADALADLERAWAIDPEDFAIINALGLAYARAGRPKDAVRLFDRAVAINPQFAPGHFNKGWASEEAGALAQAGQSYARAAALDPASPEPLAKLASLAARLGDWDGAQTNAEEALKRFPLHPAATLALATAEIGRNEWDKAATRLKALLAAEGLPEPEKATAQGLLGDALDAGNRTAEAFAAYTEQNNILLRLNAPRFRTPGIETMPQYLSWLTAYFEHSAETDWRPKDISAEGATKPVFMVGFPRSGTTLLEEALAAIPGVVTTQERDGLASGVRDFMANPDGLNRLAAAEAAQLRTYRQAYWRQLEDFGIAPAAATVVDKQPYNTIKLPLICRLFPGAKILFCVRDPRDVVFSCFRRRFRMNPSNFELLSLEGAARFYGATNALAEIYRRKLPLDIYQVRHEDLVGDFDATLRSLCAFLGLEWSERTRNFADNARQRMIVTPSAAQIVRGLNPDGIGQWRRYKPQLAPVLPILGPWVERYGYSAD